MRYKNQMKILRSQLIDLISTSTLNSILEMVFKPLYDNRFFAPLITLYSEDSRDKTTIGFLNFINLFLATYFIYFVFTTLILEKMLTEMGYTNSTVTMMLMGLGILTSALVRQIIKLSAPHYLGLKLWARSLLPLN